VVLLRSQRPRLPGFSRQLDALQISIKAGRKAQKKAESYVILLTCSRLVTAVTPEQVLLGGGGGGGAGGGGGGGGGGGFSAKLGTIVFRKCKHSTQNII
jgi:hypothetical protein